MKYINARLTIYIINSGRADHKYQEIYIKVKAKIDKY